MWIAAAALFHVGPLQFEMPAGWSTAPTEMPATTKIAAQKTVQTRSGPVRDDLLITPLHESLDAARERLAKYFPNPTRKDVGSAPAWWFTNNEVDASSSAAIFRRTVLLQACGRVWSIEGHWLGSRAETMQPTFERFVASLDMTTCN